MEKSHKNQSFKNIIGAIVMAVLFICIIVVLATGFVFKSKNSTPSIFGYNIYVMDGSGMEPYIPDESAVFVKKGQLPEGNDALWRVALCNIVDNELTTVLRVYGIEQTDGVTNYIMKSDAAPETQMISVSSDKVIGEAVKYDKILGKVIVFVTSKIGMIVLVILPATLIIILYLLSVLRKVKIDESEYGLTYENEQEGINENEQDNEPEIIKQVLQPLQVVVDERGEAQYEDKKPVKSVHELDGFLFSPQTKVKSPQEKLPAPKSFEFKATAEDIKQVKKPQFENETKSDNKMEMFISPKKATPVPKKTSNQTLEELMKMLDKKEKEIRK